MVFQLHHHGWKRWPEGRSEGRRLTGTGPAIWRAAVTLPGADHCEIEQTHEETMGGRWIGKFYYYICQTSYSALQPARLGFEEIAEMLAGALQWKIERQKGSGNDLEILSVKDDNKNSARSFDIRLTKSNSVQVTMYPDYLARAAANIRPDLVAAAIHRALLAAIERPSFGSITGARESSGERWEASAAIPGAQSCSISLIDTTKRPIYGCWLAGRSNAESLASYQSLLEIVKRSGEWALKDSSATSDSLKSAQFTAALGPLLLLSLERDGTVKIIIFGRN